MMIIIYFVAACLYRNFSYSRTDKEQIISCFLLVYSEMEERGLRNAAQCIKDQNL